VVYKGTAGGVLVTDLAPNTAYSVVVYEYTGTGASTDYMLADAPSATNTGTHSTTDVPVHNMDYGVDCAQCHEHNGFGTNGDPELITWPGGAEQTGVLQSHDAQGSKSG
jgi:hypothetical protein